MGTWSVSTSGENYIMEYSNGFKRSIRKSQVTKTSKGAIVTYASSQSPNLTLAERITRKHHFWSFLAITIDVYQIQMILTLISLQNQHVGMGYAQNKKILLRA